MGSYFCAGPKLVRRVFPVTGFVVTLLAALAATPVGAANDELILPPPTYANVTRLLNAGNYPAALDRLTAAVQDDGETVLLPRHGDRRPRAHPERVRCGLLQKLPYIVRRWLPLERGHRASW